MRFFQSPSPFLCFLAFTSSVPVSNTAALLPENRFLPANENHLVERQCAKPCGFYHQVCCQSNEECITDASGEAQCGAGHDAGGSPAGQGDWQYYTTTYVMTDRRTITSTMSSFFSIPTQNLAGPTTAVDHGGCSYALQEVPCGGICCSAGQYCMTDINQCAAFDGGSSGLHSSFFTDITSASLPSRPTSNTVFVVTATGSATTTVPFEPPIGTDGSSLIGVQASTTGGGLSAGAIAGIVIGVIAGIIILLLICLCCCARGAIGSIKRIFKRDNKRRTETTYVHQRHSHRGSKSAGRTWFGSRPTRVDRAEKKSGGLSGFGKVGAGLGTAALALGFKRKMDRRHAAKTESSYSYGYYDDTSDSSPSSITRSSRRVRR